MNNEDSNDREALVASYLSDDPDFAKDLVERALNLVLAVAWANKNARVLWALTHHGTTYDHARHASSKFIHQN